MKPEELSELEHAGVALDRVGKELEFDVRIAKKLLLRPLPGATPEGVEDLRRHYGVTAERFGAVKRLQKRFKCPLQSEERGAGGSRDVDLHGD